MPILDTRALKVTALVDPDALAKITVLDVPRCVIRLRVADGRQVTADVSSKSLRRAIAAVGQYGATGCIAMIQGKLIRTASGDEISECGLSVQPKAAQAKAA